MELATDQDVSRFEEERLAASFSPWRVLVCGSRTWGGSWRPGARFGSVEDKLQCELLFRVLDGLLNDAHDDLVGDRDDEGHYVLTVVHGGCPSGADAIAAHWAKARVDVRVETFPADWETHGRRAGPIRNQAMVDTLDPERLGAHMVLAAWDGESKGTLSTIRFARKAGIPVLTVGVNPST